MEESFPGFSIAITRDFLHSLGNLFDSITLFIICSSHVWVLTPRFLICSQSISSRPAALLLARALTPFFSSSIVNGSVRECSASVCDGILTLFGLCDEFPLPLSSWCATWFAVIYTVAEVVCSLLTTY